MAYRVLSGAGGVQNNQLEIVNNLQKNNPGTVTIEFILANHATSLLNWTAMVQPTNPYMPPATVANASFQLLDTNDRSQSVTIFPQQSITCCASTPVPESGNVFAPNGAIGPTTAELAASPPLLAHWIFMNPSGNYQHSATQSCCYDAPTYGQNPGQSASTTDPGYIDWSISQAQAAGVSGFMVSYTGSRTVLPPIDFNTYMTEAAKFAGWKSAPVLETHVANAVASTSLPPDANTLVAWIENIIDDYGSNPSSLKTSDGRLVIFVYEATYDGLTAATWRSIRARVAADRPNSANPHNEPVFLLGSDMNYTNLDAFDGLWFYNSLQFDNAPGQLQAMWQAQSAETQTYDLLYDQTASDGSAPYPALGRRIWMPTVTPGMNDCAGNSLTGNRYWPRLQGTRYQSEWQAADASNPDWRVIVSWEDFCEDTAIAPSTGWGTCYTDLTKLLIQNSAATIPTECDVPDQRY